MTLRPRTPHLALPLLQQGDWRARLLGGDLRKWVVLGVIIGVEIGLGISLFIFAIDRATHLFMDDIVGLALPLPRGEGSPTVVGADRRWLLPLIVALGGLMSGLLAVFITREIEGGGTDAAIAAFHDRGGRIRWRVPAAKLVASALVLGTGGSAGREGPSAQIGAGLASWVGDLFRLSAADRRVLAAVGLGAGIGTVFKAPLGGAILGAEMLYLRDFELEAIVPGLIASVVGYSIVGGFYGFTPTFGNGLGLHFDHPISLLWYAALGITAGLVIIAYARIFDAVRERFRELPAPTWVKPAIGGAAVGVVALAFPQVLSMGYGWVQLAIEGNTAELAVGTMLALVALKILTTSFTIGSGGSGGDFAPVLYVGAMLGGGMWGALHGRVGGLPAAPAPFVIVGMMALLGGAAKAPLAVMIMVAEMTGEFSMLVPAMIAAGLAYLVSGNTTLYEEQRPTRADSPAHRGEFTVPLIQTLTVGQSMHPDPLTASPADLIADAERRMSEHGQRGMPVLDELRLIGMFTVSDAMRGERVGATRVGDVMSTELIVAYPADSLHTALQRMAHAGISRLPVVDRDAPQRLTGILDMQDIAAVLDTEVSALAAAPQRATSLPLDDPLRTQLVSDVMTRRVESVAANAPVTRVANRLASAGGHAALILDDSGALQAIVTQTDIQRAADDGARPVDEIACHNLVVARPDQTVAEALAQPGADGLRQLPVVEDRDGRLVPVGLLSRSDVVAAYLRSRDRQSRIARRAAELADRADGSVHSLELRVTRGSFVDGRTLADLRLPRDAVITAVLRDDVVVIPRGQVQLEPGDRVQILSTAQARAEVLRRFSAAADAPAES